MKDLNQLKFTKTHEWFRLDGSKGRVGITQHAQEEISDVVFVELPKLNRSVSPGDEVAVVESVKAAFSIYAPISGTITGVNEALARDPGLLNRDPYGEGWIYVLDNVESNHQENLLSNEQYESWVKGQGQPHG